MACTAFVYDQQTNRISDSCATTVYNAGVLIKSCIGIPTEPETTMRK